MTSGQAHMTHLVIVCLADTQKTKSVDFQFLIFLFYLDLQFILVCLNIYVILLLWRHVKPIWLISWRIFVVKTQ
jgi:hypothetical protein